MEAKFLFLGTGASTGVPMIGCRCKVCRSNSSKNKRLRPSGLIMVGEKIFLLDASPDFREQALKYGIRDIDGLLLTHMHYDHAGGLDELRVFSILKEKKIPALLSKDSFLELKCRYPYLFKRTTKKRTLCVKFDFKVLKKEYGKVLFEKIKIEYFSFFQKETKVLGFKIGNFAYISDIREYEEKIFDFLKGTEILVLSALRDRFSPVHFSLKEAILFSKKVKAKKTYFTHIAHEIDYTKFSNKLEKGIFLAFDGLKIPFKYIL